MNGHFYPFPYFPYLIIVFLSLSGNNNIQLHVKPYQPMHSTHYFFEHHWMSKVYPLVGDAIQVLILSTSSASKGLAFVLMEKDKSLSK